MRNALNAFDNSKIWRTGGRQGADRRPAGGRTRRPAGEADPAAGRETVLAGRSVPLWPACYPLTDVTGVPSSTVRLALQGRPPPLGTATTASGGGERALSAPPLSGNPLR